MREIKVKAWDSKFTRYDENDEVIAVGCMTDAIELQDLISMKYIHYLGGDSYCEYYREDFEHLIWMQYTGLKDKNGVEIYEGDIVKVLGDPSEVSMINSSWCYQRIDNFNIQPLGDFGSTAYEVIGNIYEQPELLEEA